MANPKIKLGVTSFNDIVADASIKFTVLEQKGDVYLCQSDDEDYGVVTRYFDEGQILGKVQWENAIDGLFNRADQFWANQTVGNVLHYHNSFGKFVRGVVVEKDGKKMLKPTALVGEWTAMDLPKRNPDGSVTLPYNAKKILEPDAESAWQPNDGCVYESPSYGDSPSNPKVDPRTLPEIDLSVPDMTPEEMETAAKEVRLQAIAEVIGTRYKTRMTADDALAEVKRLLTA